MQKNKIANKTIKKPQPYINKRRWGTENRFIYNTKCTVKILNVLKGEQISVQYHFKRAEFWHVISGKVKILKGKKWYTAERGTSFWLPKKTVHSVIGIAKESRILEISQGEFQQTDIIRLQDKYGRK
ncbi:MAG: cupin domain-containing protein [Candidatus Woesearchaeota archaeon]